MKSKQRKKDGDFLNFSKERKKKHDSSKKNDSFMSHHGKNVSVTYHRFQLL